VQIRPCASNLLLARAQTEKLPARTRASSREA
jgi:hypothetical protein